MPWSRIDGKYIIAEYLNALKLPVDEDTFMNDVGEINLRLIEKNFDTYLSFRETASGQIWSSDAASALQTMIHCRLADVDEKTGGKAYFKINSRYRERGKSIEKFIESHEEGISDKDINAFHKTIRDFMKDKYGKSYQKPSMNSRELGVLALDTIYLLRNNSFDVEQQQEVLDAFHKCACINQQEIKEGYKRPLK